MSEEIEVIFFVLCFLFFDSECTKKKCFEKKIYVCKWLKSLHRYYLASFNDHLKPIKNVHCDNCVDRVNYVNHVDRVNCVNLVNCVDCVNHVNHFNCVDGSHVQQIHLTRQHVNRVQHVNHVQHVGQPKYPEADVDDNIKFGNKSDDKVPFIILRIFRLMVRLIKTFQ